MTAPLPANEGQRLAALRRYKILDTPSEPAFDDIALLASTICDTPIGVLTLVDADRQWFKAKVGLDAEQTPREHAFCAHTILGLNPMIVGDATLDARFADNPLVTGSPDIRFYAGAPLIDSEGFALGSLCVIDRKPRELQPHQQRALEALGRQVIAQLEFRRASADLAKALADLHILRGLLPICCYCKSIRNDEGYWHTVETYVTEHSEASFSHGICPGCMTTHFPGVVTGTR
ncbi:MAG: hypothetical protein JWO08_695 [Verrucomicrobiaceae bacterium]|nr:hypothetical protein [Verrucomicrobiaceae bacterium]